MYIYIMKYYSAMKSEEIVQFAAAWMELRGITLSKISSTETDKYCMTSLICGI